MVVKFESATDLIKIPEARSAKGFFIFIRSLLAELRNENKKDQLRDSGEGF